MNAAEWSHFDDEGRARMVDVGDKLATRRWAVARGMVLVSAPTLEKIRAGGLRKGDLRAAAELAGVMAAKKTSELIPLCHPLPLDHVEVRVELSEEPPAIILTGRAEATSRTGVEMEALTAVAVAALTVYDMIKAVERGARIAEIRLVEKHGGSSGDIVLE